MVKVQQKDVPDLKMYLLFGLIYVMIVWWAHHLTKVMFSKMHLCVRRSLIECVICEEVLVAKENETFANTWTTVKVLKCIYVPSKCE
jgi:hypothetical protein